MQYRFIEKQDIKTLADLRLEYLRETTERAIPGELQTNTVQYLETEFAAGTLAGIVAAEDGQIIAIGMMSLFSIMPTVRNATGKRGYLFNFYTNPEFRRQGIATAILNRLKDEASRRGVVDLFLNAREMAIPLYEKTGFTFLHHEMRAMTNVRQNISPVGR